MKLELRALKQAATDKFHPDLRLIGSQLSFHSDSSQSMYTQTS